MSDLAETLKLIELLQKASKAQGTEHTRDIDGAMAKALDDPVCGPQIACILDSDEFKQEGGEA